MSMKPMDDNLIAGALFDLMGFLTTREHAVTLGAKHDAVPAVDLLKEWAETRGLDLSNAEVIAWRDHAGAPLCIGNGWGRGLNVSGSLEFADEDGAVRVVITAGQLKTIVQEAQHRGGQ